MLYRWILFDADNTLLDFDRAERFALEGALAEAGFSYRPEYVRAYHEINRACWRAYEAGELDRDRLRILRFERLLAFLGTTEDDPLPAARRLADAYMRRLARADFLMHECERVLRQLADAVRMVMVTNGLSEVQRPRLARSGLASYFEAVIIADEIGVSKPHARFFQHTFDAIGRPDPGSVLIVGDNLVADIGGGQAFGLDTCWFNPGRLPNASGYAPTYEIEALGQLHDLLKTRADDF